MHRQDVVAGREYATGFAHPGPATMPVVLEIRHVTTYRYARPVSFGTHRVLFRPRAAHDIRVLTSRLDVTPDSRQRWIHDAFSNSVALVEPLAPAHELRFEALVSIEHHGVMNRELPLAPGAEDLPFAYSDEYREDLAPYMQLQHPQDEAPLRDWVARFLPDGGRGPIRTVLDRLNAGIHDEFAYSARTEPGTQSPGRTLARRSGTCRDFALLMMEATRTLGLAARFVSGYLYDAALDASFPAASVAVESRDAGGTRGSGATHAWLHVFLPGAGWVPFDPTNTLDGGTDLIRVACTRTPEQAAPVSGQWIGAAQDFLGMSVDVQVRRLTTAGTPVAQGGCDAADTK